MNQPQHIVHTLPPVFDQNSRILILGTMPSPKSRENGFYYGNPQNRFFRVLAALFSAPLPQNNEERKQLLLNRNIALWDVLAACDIVGASDSSIRNPVPNDIPWLLEQAPIRAVFTTGSTATRLYQKLVFPATQIPCIPLPSTSPANQGRFPFEKLLEEYQKIQNFL